MSLKNSKIKTLWRNPECREPYGMCTYRDCERCHELRTRISSISTLSSHPICEGPFIPCSYSSGCIYCSHFKVIKNQLDTENCHNLQILERKIAKERHDSLKKLAKERYDNKMLEPTRFVDVFAAKISARRFTGMDELLAIAVNIIISDYTPVHWTHASQYNLFCDECVLERGGCILTSCFHLMSVFHEIPQAIIVDMLCSMNKMSLIILFSHMSTEERKTLVGNIKLLFSEWKQMERLRIKEKQFIMNCEKDIRASKFRERQIEKFIRFLSDFVTDSSYIGLLRIMLREWLNFPDDLVEIILSY